MVDGKRRVGRRVGEEGPLARARGEIDEEATRWDSPVRARENSRTRACTNEAARGRNEITKLVGESYLHFRCNKPILDLPLRLLLPSVSISPLVPSLLHLFREDTVRPGCKQPFPNWTAFRRGGPSFSLFLPLSLSVFLSLYVYALPEFSLARYSVVTESPRYAAYLYTSNTDTRAAPRS